MGRLKSGPLGSYTYGDPAHVHAATSTSTGYTATYDAAGDMTCRAPNTASTCTGTATGAQLSYNNEGELAAWQSRPTSPSSTAAYLYDGQGERVAQQVTQGAAPPPPLRGRRGRGKHGRLHDPDHYLLLR